MTERVPIRQLQQHASELVNRAAAGERIEITRNGRLIAVLAPPDPEQRVIEDLLRDGTLDPENVERAHGLGDWNPLPASEGRRPLSEILAEQREEEDR